MTLPDRPHVGLVLTIACMAILAPGTVWSEGNEPPAQIAVSPSRFEIELGSKPTTEALSVINFSSEPVRIQATVANWDLDDANNIRILAPHEQSLAQWMVINPLRFTIPGGGSQTVRFSVRPKVRPAPGEHRAMIYFDQVLSDKGQANLRVKFRLGVAVYGFAGEVTRIGRLNSVDVDVEGPRPVAKFDISSNGSAHVRMQGQYAIYPVAAYPGITRTSAIPELDKPGAVWPAPILLGGRLPSRPVLPGARREVVMQLGKGLPPGTYVLDINGELPGTPIDTAIQFTVRPEHPDTRELHASDGTATPPKRRTNVAVPVSSPPRDDGTEEQR